MLMVSFYKKPKQKLFNQMPKPPSDSIQAQYCRRSEIFPWAGNCKVQTRHQSMLEEVYNPTLTRYHLS